MASFELLSKSLGELELIQKEEFNAEYEGAIVRRIEDQLDIRSRRAKLTPKKAGYFVAFWEKDANNKNQPFKVAEAPDKLAIVVIDGDKQGYFLFGKETAALKQIYSSGQTKGKMAMRFYPDWCTELNATAKKTQAWQTKYFVNLS